MVFVCSRVPAAAAPGVHCTRRVSSRCGRGGGLSRVFAPSPRLRHPSPGGARGSGVRTGFYCVLLVMAIYASIRCACTPFGARCAVTRRSHEGTEVSGVRLGRRGVRRARSARWDFALSFSTRKKKAPKKNALSIGRRKTRPPVASPTLAHPVRHRGAALTRRAA